MNKSRILPLRTIELRSKPLNKHAIAWSSDAELAVAADDSVTVFLPDFPLLDPHHDDTADDDDEAQDDGDGGGALAAHEAGENGLSILPLGLRSGVDGGDNNYDDDMLSSGSEDDVGDDMFAQAQQQRDGGDAGFPGSGPVDRRQQFGQLRRQLLLSHPALSPDLNVHVWEAVGKTMPVIPANLPAGDLKAEGTVKTRGDERAGSEESGNESEEDGEKDGEGRDEEEEEEEEEALGEGDDDDAEVPGQRSRSHRRTAPPVEVNPHPGAGTSLIGGAGSSMNHVVALGWSPPGLGRNLRPVLAVLTGVGSLAVYGDGAHLPFGSAGRPWRVLGQGALGGAARNLDGWLALWAVGENFVVPGQEEYGYGEFVRAFAWCRDMGPAPGRALLAYVNDLRELVVVCVGTRFRTTEDGLDEALWNVREVLRMEAAGPHGQPDPYDPDFVPSGSSYCVRWSPWLKGEETWSCLISYTDRNYVGFKKITINAPGWIPTEAPVVIAIPQDWHGQCCDLTADAFLEFEDTVWDVGGDRICRGMIATPLRLEPFQVDLGRKEPREPMPAHSTEQCGTNLPRGLHTNPITGLVIHPLGIDIASPPMTPLYTAVRLSATATNAHWCESNLPPRLGRTPAGADETPQWVRDIEAKIHTRTTVAMAGRIPGHRGDDGDDDDQDSQDGEDGIIREDDAGSEDAAAAAPGSDDDNDDDADDDDDDDGDSHADFDPWAAEGPEVLPWRVRLWGLALSPGGGSTAVLATPQLATRPERADWSTHRSQVLFGYQRRRPRGRARPQQQQQHLMDPAMAMDVDGGHYYDAGGGGSGVEGGATDVEEQEEEEEEEESMLNVEDLSVEARLWEWMYGGGPGVPGITPSTAATSAAATAATAIDNAPHQRPPPPSLHPRRAAQLARDAQAQARRDRIASFFRPFLRDDADRSSRVCVVCADGRSTLTPLPLTPAAAEAEAEAARAILMDENGGVLPPPPPPPPLPPRRHVDCECPAGHQFALCGVSGLPIAAAGVSRSCGACHARCMTAAVLADRWLAPAGRAAEAEVVRAESDVGVCPRCGGKFLD